MATSPVKRSKENWRVFFGEKEVFAQKNGGRHPGALARLGVKRSSGKARGRSNYKYGERKKTKAHQPAAVWKGGNACHSGGKKTPFCTTVRQRGGIKEWGKLVAQKGKKARQHVPRPQKRESIHITKGGVVLCDPAFYGWERSETSRQKTYIHTPHALFYLYTQKEKKREKRGWKKTGLRPKKKGEPRAIFGRRKRPQLAVVWRIGTGGEGGEVKRKLPARCHQKGAEDPGKKERGAKMVRAQVPQLLPKKKGRGEGRRQRGSLPLSKKKIHWPLRAPKKKNEQKLQRMKRTGNSREGKKRKKIPQPRRTETGCWGKAGTGKPKRRPCRCWSMQRRRKIKTSEKDTAAAKRNHHSPERIFRPGGEKKKNSSSTRGLFSQKEKRVWPKKKKKKNPRKVVISGEKPF